MRRPVPEPSHANMRRRVVIGAAVILCPALLISVVYGAGPHATDRAQRGGRSDPQWDSSFTRINGWTGADVIGTVDLQDGRTVWMFGDTWIGRVAGGSHVPGSRLVNNSIAVHSSSSEHPADPPNAEDLKFYWGPDDAGGHPTAWIVPDAASPAPEREPKADEQGASGWFWATGGGVFLPGDNGPTRLILFLFHVGRRNSENSVWNFENIGGAMAVIDNPADATPEWQIRQLPIPHTITAKDARDRRDLKQTSWGMAAFVDPVDDESGSPQFVYVYGVREAAPFNKQAVLARVAPAEIERFERWQFYAGDDNWSSELSEAVAVANRLTSEFSVERYDANERTVFVMVHSEPVFGTRIFVRTASRPEGPWSKAVPIFNVPDVKRHRSFFTYAAKGHLHLSRPGELLVSYVVNAHDFKAMVNDAFIYRPRFVKVPLQPILAGD